MIFRSSVFLMKKTLGFPLTISEKILDQRLNPSDDMSPEDKKRALVSWNKVQGKLLEYLLSQMSDAGMETPPIGELFGELGGWFYRYMTDNYENENYQNDDYFENDLFDELKPKVLNWYNAKFIA